MFNMKWRRTNKYLPSGKRVSNTFNQTVPPQLYRLGNPRDQMRCACVTGPDGQMCKRACTLNGCKSWTGTFETRVPTGVTGRAADGTTGTGTILVPGPAGTELRTCKGTPYRNPIAGYRKERICDCCVCSWATVWTGTQQVENTTCPHGMPCPTGSIPTNTIYKDNYSRSCISLKDGPVGPGSISACYDPLIKVKQNKNGQIDEQYNYNSKQYLERRCRGYRQKVFNFQGHIGGRGSKNYRGSCSQCAPGSKGRSLAYGSDRCRRRWGLWVVIRGHCIRIRVPYPLDSTALWDKNILSYLYHSTPYESILLNRDRRTSRT